MTKQINIKFRNEIFKLAIPFALQSLLNSLVGASDALMLGRLTQDSVSAVSLANQISFIMSLFLSSVVGACGVLVAQYYGKNDKNTVSKFLSMSLRYCLILGIIFFVLALLIPDKLMMLFTKDETLISIGSSYLRIVSFSYVFNAASQSFMMLMKVDGREKLPVFISLGTVVLDMTLDFFLIYGFKSIPALGADGSAYSTIAVEILSLVLCLVFSSKKEIIKPDKKQFFVFSKNLEKELIKIELPMLASALSWGLSMSVHSSIVGHLDNDLTAAYSVTAVTIQLIQCVTIGCSSGAGIIIGDLLGRNELEEAKIYGSKCWGLSLFCGIVNATLILIVGPLVYVFYKLTPEAKTYLVYMLLFNLAYMFAYAFNTVFTCGVFPAGGDSKYDAISVLITTWCLAIPLSILCWKVFNFSPFIVYLVMSLDEIVKVPFLYGRYKKYIWVKNLTV